MVGCVRNKRYAYFEDPAATPVNLHYLGPKTVAEVNGILAKSQFLVHTCEPEGFGNVFIQAWLQGRPTLTLEYDPDGIIAREALGAVGGTLAGLLLAVRLTWRIRIYARRRDNVRSATRKPITLPVLPWLRSRLCSPPRLPDQALFSRKQYAQRCNGYALRG